MRYTRRVQVPADEHAREKSSCATDAAATAVEAATHAPITDGTSTRDATLVHCVVNNDSMNEFQWLRVCAVAVV